MEPSLRERRSNDRRWIALGLLGIFAAMGGLGHSIFYGKKRSADEASITSTNSTKRGIWSGTGRSFD